MRIVHAALLLLAVTACERTSTSSTENQAPPALKDAFAGAFLVGTAVNFAHIYGRDQQGIALIKTHFNSITPENAMKWDSIHPQPESYDFDAADRFVEFGTRHGMFMIGHTLVWHTQTPQWVFEDADGKPLEREELLQRLREHIHTVVGRYKGRIQGWDVVNEALNEDGTLRDSPWREIIGDDYIEKAFQYAHETDPRAELYYNDFSLENLAKRKAAIRLVKSLQAKNIPLSAVGTHGHYLLDWPTTGAVVETIDSFAALGVKVMITEMEIDVLPDIASYRGADFTSRELSERLDPYRHGLPDDVQRRLALRYREMFKVFLDHEEAITRVTFWGVTDGDSWKNEWPVPGRRNHPLVFDRQAQPKPAFFSIVELARERLRK